MRSTPFSDGLDTVTVTVKTGSPLAEVFLIDHAFALTDRAVGDLSSTVAPGVYKVKATLGEAATERLVVLNADQQIDLSGELQVPSPAPLAGTGLTHESHVKLATDRSGQVQPGTGEGAQVLIVSRRFSGDAPSGDPARAPLDEVSLRGADGETVLDLAGASGWDPVVGRTVEVDPGPYLLRWRDHGGAPVEQTVPAVKGWQTQVFLLEEAQGPEEALRNKVSVLMSRAGFDPNDESPRLVEEARTALADERKVSDRANNELLFAKFDNPMLGLFGAHLMLLGVEALEAAGELDKRTDVAKRPQAPVEFDQDLFNGAVANLRSLLGERHPDVIALSTRATDVGRGDIRPIEIPPMLWRSWLLLIEASNEWPDLVPVHIWRETARLLPLRPFLVWSPADGEAGAEAAELEMARLMKRTVDEAAGAAASAAADVARRELTSRMLLPAAAVDELIRRVS